MIRSLVIAVVATALVAAILTLTIVLRVAHPTEAGDAIFGGLWLIAPFLAAIVLAILMRRLQPAMIVLLVTTAVAGVGGVTVFFWAASQLVGAQNDLNNAVLPGEDPDRGPGGMRKTGADLGYFFTGALMIFWAIVLPIIQWVIIVLPAGIVGIVNALQRRRPVAQPAEVRE